MFKLSGFYLTDFRGVVDKTRSWSQLLRIRLIHPSLQSKLVTGSLGLFGTPTSVLDSSRDVKPQLQGILAGTSIAKACLCEGCKALGHKVPSRWNRAFKIPSTKERFSTY